jgi:hypothetical protein
MAASTNVFSTSHHAGFTGFISGVHLWLIKVVNLSEPDSIFIGVCRGCMPLDQDPQDLRDRCGLCRCVLDGACRLCWGVLDGACRLCWGVLDGACRLCWGVLDRPCRLCGYSNNVLPK